MIYITQNILVLLKNQLNYLKDSIFECLFKEHFFFITFNDGKIKSEKRKHNHRCKKSF